MERYRYSVAKHHDRCWTQEMAETWSTLPSRSIRGHRHTGVFEHRIPARFLVVDPLPDAFAVGRPSCASDGVRKAAQLLAGCKHSQAFALSTPVYQGVELRAERLADRGRDGREFP